MVVYRKTSPHPNPWDMWSYLEQVFAEVIRYIELTLDYPGVLKPRAKCLYKDTQKRIVQRRGVGHVTTGAKIGVVLLQIKKSLMPWGPGSSEKVPSRALRVSTAHWHFDLGLLSWRTLREYIGAISSPHGCHCFANLRKLMNLPDDPIWSSHAVTVDFIFFTLHIADWLFFLFPCSFVFPSHKVNSKTATIICSVHYHYL